jgi:hypothetical protein
MTDQHWNLVSAVANCITALGVFIAAAQMFLEHRRALHDRAVEAMRNWIEQVSQRDHAKFRLIVILEKRVAQFSSDCANAARLKNAIEKVCLAEPFLLDPPEADTFRELFGFQQTPLPKEVNRGQSVMLRAEVMSYLNWLEWVLSTWDQKIVDRKFIERQFEDFCDKDTGRFAFEVFYAGLGGKDSFPCLTKYLEWRRRKLHHSFPAPKGR